MQSRCSETDQSIGVTLSSFAFQRCKCFANAMALGVVQHLAGSRGGRCPLSASCCGLEYLLNLRRMISVHKLSFHCVVALPPSAGRKVPPPPPIGFGFWFAKDIQNQRREPRALRCNPCAIGRAPRAPARTARRARAVGSRSFGARPSNE